MFSKKCLMFLQTSTLQRRNQFIGQVCSRMITKETTTTEAKPSLLRRMFFSQKKSSRPLFKWGLFTGIGSAMFLMYSVRKYRDSLVMDLKIVHPDNSEVRIASVKTQVVPTVKFVKIETMNESSASIVDEEKYSEFVKKSVEALLVAQKEMEDQSSR